MNLEKLFNMQAQLDADILAHHPVQDGEDRLSKKVLALLVELGETAQEARFFKFWSNDQEPRTEQTCESCDGKGYKRRFNMHDGERRKVRCSKCDGTGTTGNPLLEEYVDTVHFVLSIGNDIGFKLTSGIVKSLYFAPHNHAPIEETFLYTFGRVMAFKAALMCDDSMRIFYAHMLQGILTLGATLGFTMEQIEQAYYDKNKVNFERQANGY